MLLGASCVNCSCMYALRRVGAQMQTVSFVLRTLVASTERSMYFQFEI